MEGLYLVQIEDIRLLAAAKRNMPNLLGLYAINPATCQVCLQEVISCKQNPLIAGLGIYCILLAPQSVHQRKIHMNDTQKLGNAPIQIRRMDFSPRILMQQAKQIFDAEGNFCQRMAF